MNCHQFEQFLDPYLDGDLRGTLKLEFEAHLVDCEPCGHLYGMMEAMGEIISAPSPEEPALGPDFTDRVLAGLAAETESTRKFRRVMARISLAASVALVAGTIVFSMGRSAVWSSRIGGNDLVALTRLFSLAPDAKPTLLASSSPIPLDRKTQPEINLWLAGTLERAGSSLWELKDLRNSTLDQMRRGLFASLAGTLVLPEQQNQERSEPNLTPQPAAEKNNDLSPRSGGNDGPDPGLELL